jgi:LacI family transcriptional regulator
LAEIAEAAGVSVPSVSRVLNGRPGISARKRDEIERLLEESGYERRRTRREAAFIDFVIVDLNTQWATELLRGAQAEAARAGADLVITATHGLPAGSPDWVERLAARGTAGVVLVVSELAATARDELARLEVPVVLIDPVGGDTESFVSVSATDWAAGRDATEHLLGLGHRRIGFVTGPLGLECHQDRLDGYFSALGRAGLTRDMDLVREGDSLIGGGQR